jgi:hypothetical protein
MASLPIKPLIRFFHYSYLSRMLSFEPKDFGNVALNGKYGKI